MLALHNAYMLPAHASTAPQFKAQDLSGLSPAALAEVAVQMLAHIGRQSQQIAERDRAIKFKDAKIELITFELARLKAWKFAARTEAMNAEQRHVSTFFVRVLPPDVYWQFQLSVAIRAGDPVAMRATSPEPAISSTRCPVVRE